MMIGVLFGNFCSSCFIKISVSFYVKITFFPDFFDDLTPVARYVKFCCRINDYAAVEYIFVLTVLPCRKIIYIIFDFFA